MLGRSKFFVLMIAVFVMITFFYGSEIGFSTNSTTSGGFTLVIWDDADSEGGGNTRYTYGTSWSKTSGDWNVTFFANYTNSSGGPIDNGNCTMRINDTGQYSSWSNMSYNPSSKLFSYYSNFTYNGLHKWEVNCTNSTNNLDVVDNITITNTAPVVFAKNPSGYLPAKTCYEDTECYYNFSANCTDDDKNDVLTYDYASGTGFAGFSINSATGMVTVNITNDSSSGSYNTTLLVIDSSEGSDSATKPFTVYAVNDPPQFTNLPDYLNTTQNSTYYLDLNATDEESNTPFYFNITFLAGCARPYGDSNNCSIFTINITTGEINFTSDNSMVGNYTINFTVRDSGQTIQPYNATRSKLVNFSVINLNDLPNMDYVENQNMTQGDNFYLVINGTDPDNDTLTFNTTTFYLNLTQYTNTSLFPIWTNNTNYPNESSRGVMNFTVRNDQVGNYTLNITLSDGNGGFDWQLVNFTVNNTNDPPNLSSIGNQTAVQGMEFYLDVNATDPDQETPYGDTLAYYLNFAWCDRPADPGNCTIFSINQTTGEINFTASSSEVGNYTINISVNDTACSNVVPL